MFFLYSLLRFLWGFNIPRGLPIGLTASRGFFMPRGFVSYGSGLFLSPSVSPVVVFVLSLVVLLVVAFLALAFVLIPLCWRFDRVMLPPLFFLARTLSPFSLYSPPRFSLGPRPRLSPFSYSCPFFLVVSFCPFLLLYYWSSGLFSLVLCLLSVLPDVAPSCRLWWVFLGGFFFIRGFPWWYGRFLVLPASLGYPTFFPVARLRFVPFGGLLLPASFGLCLWGVLVGFAFACLPAVFLSGSNI